MRFQFSYTAENICLTVLPEQPIGLLRFLKKPAPASLKHYSKEDQRLLFAIADLRSLGEELGAPPQIEDAQIIMSHEMLAHLDSQIASALDLPPLTEFTLKTDTEGELGKPSFKLSYAWFYKQQPQFVKRTGAVLETALGMRRLPYFMMEALNIADRSRNKDGSLEGDWEALARFRHALELRDLPGENMEEEEDALSENDDFSEAANNIAMGKFFKGLKINLADGFSIAKARNGDETDFEVMPFSKQKLAQASAENAPAEEKSAELSDFALESFQRNLRNRGVLPAYQVEKGHYLVVDRSAEPVLRLMAEKQHAPIEERREFIENPYPALRQAAEKRLMEAGALEGLSPEEQEETINAQFSAFIETREYSDRVVGVKLYKKSQMAGQGSEGTQWLPEDIPDGLADDVRELLGGQPAEEIKAFIDKVETAAAEGQEKIEVAGGREYPPAAILAVISDLQREWLIDKAINGIAAEPETGAIILDTKDNNEELSYLAALHPREPLIKADLPSGIAAKLRDYQLEGFQNQRRSWAAGMPGILNADEQGLGKTLQTIAFLRWLKDNAAAKQRCLRDDGDEKQLTEWAETAEAGPVLIVAPTSLLTNWQEEVKIHCPVGLGELIPLYGCGLSQYKSGRGRETESGEAMLDFSGIRELIEKEGFGHHYWFLTTYNSLTDYQHSLAKIKFSAIIFDEIQALKNPYSLRACAARSMNADYRIGLTGTPIENASTDLWAIMDILAPGALDSQKEFQKKYAMPNESNMRELYNRVFAAKNSRAPEPLAFRRLKRDAAKDLPKKRRFLHPKLMPDTQAQVYDAARSRLAAGGRKSALQQLQHIRGVSVHPNLSMQSANADFIKASARLDACFDILRAIKAKNERALVFIESRKMQERFIALAQQEFGLNKIEHINGATPQRDRQKIVERFQRHLTYGGGFDLLVLGPRAAGTGLTLTAATHIIHLSRWWNPAVEEQCNDRAHRIGQKHDVSIHMPMAIHKGYLDNSFDCLLQNLMQRKRKLAEAALWPMGDTEEDTARLFNELENEKKRAASEGEDLLKFTMRAMFEAEDSAGKEITPHCWQID